MAEIEQAFKQIDRADFVPPEYKNEAYHDHPLPIGWGATISQPSTVLFMLKLLDPKPGEKILDIGSGSGWTTALLAHMVGQQGKVIGLEIIPELVEFGSNNLKKYNLPQATIIQAAPFDPSTRSARSGSTLSEVERVDKILVSAAASKLPEELVEQLKLGGRLVIPVLSSVWQIDRTAKDEIEQCEYPGFAFVPLR